MIEPTPDVSYIVVGSQDRLSKIKSYQIEGNSDKEGKGQSMHSVPSSI